MKKLAFLQRTVSTTAAICGAVIVGLIIIPDRGPMAIASIIVVAILVAAIMNITARRRPKFTK